MATNLGEAVVEILADIDEFDDDLRRRLQESADEAAERVEQDLDRINRAAAETGRELGDRLGEGAEEAQDRVTRMVRLTEEAQEAFENLDRESLQRIAEEAQEAQRDMEELARAARAAEGAFEGMDPEELERIAQEAEQAQRHMEDLQRQAERAGRVLDDFNEEEIRRLAREAEEAREEMERLSRTRLQRVGHEARNAGRAIFQAFRGAGEEAERALERIDNERFRELVRSAQRAADRVGRAFRRIDTDQAREGFTRTGNALRTLLLLGAQLGVLGLQVSSVATAAAGLVAAVAPSAEIVAGLPAAILLGVAAFSTLKVALLGVGDAFSAALGDDAAAFEESLENLAPPARKVAKELRSLKPAFDDLRESVQAAFFRPLVGQIRELGQNLLGPLRRGMTGVAAEFGRLARGLTDFGRSAEAVRLVEDIFGTLRDQLSGIGSDTITNLFAALSRFTRATLPAFDGLGASIDGALNRFSRFLDAAAASGDALRWVREGGAVVAQLGRIFRNVGSVIVGVGRAIQAAGGGALASLESLTAGLGDFVASAQGQAALVSIFRALAQVGAQMLPVVTALVTGLGTLAPIVGELAQQVGPALTAAITAAVPALEGIGAGLVEVFEGLRVGIERVAASGALGELGRALGELLAALAPLGPALGDVAVSALRSLAIAAQLAAPALEVVARAIASLASSPLGVVLGPLVAQLLLVRLVTGSLGTAFKSLVPVLKMVGKAALFLSRALIGLVVANPIVALVVGIVAALVFLLSRIQAVRDAVARFGDALAEGFGRLKAFGTSLIDTFKVEGPIAALRQLGSAILTGLGEAITRAAALVPRLLTAVLGGIASLLGRVPVLMTQLGDAISAGLQRVTREAPRVARELGAALRDGFAQLRDQAPQIIASLRASFGAALAALRTEGPRIHAALSALLRAAFGALVREGPGLARQAGQALNAANSAMLRFAAEAIRRGGDALAANLPRISAKVAQVLSDLIRRAGEAIPQALAGLSERLRGGIDNAAGQAAGGAGQGAGGAKLKQSIVDLLVDVGAEFLRQTVRLTPIILQALAQISGAVTKAAIAAAPGIIAALARLMVQLGNELLAQLGAFLASIPLRLLAALTPLPQSLATRGQQAMLGFLRGLLSGWPGVLAFVLSLPGRLFSALGSLPGRLAARATQAMASFRGRLNVGGSSSTTLMSALPGRLAGALGSLPGRLAARATAAMASFRGRLDSGGGGAAAAMRGVASRVVGALAGLPGRLASVGAAVMQGFISGVKSYAGQVAASVVGPIQDAISKARSLLAIGSPSKVFRDIGKFVGQGFVQGMTGESRKIQSTAEKLVKLITDAFRGRKTRLDDRLIAGIKRQNTRLQALAKQRERIADTLKKANELAASVTQSVQQFAGLSGLAAPADGEALTGAGLADQLKDRLAAIRKFQADVNKLAKRGLSRSLLGQIFEAGPDQGGALAAALASSSSATLAELNRTQKQIDEAAKGMGRTAADVMYDSGAAAGRGFLAGLKQQQAAITKLMTKIAKDTAAAVKRALKIRSPSRVMRDLGGFTIEGFLAGIADLAPEIERAMAAAVTVRESLARRLEAQLAAGPVTAPAPAAAGAGGLAAPRTGADSLAAIVGLLDRVAARASGVPVKQVEVHAPVTVNLPVADPDAVGRVVSARITSAASR